MKGKNHKTHTKHLAPLLLMMASPLVLADSYLADLEAEANAISEQKSETVDSNWSHKKQGLSENLKSGLSQQQFENNLRANYYGSYIFYAKLSDRNKKKVFETYQQSGDIEQVRDEIKVRMVK